MWLDSGFNCYYLNNKLLDGRVIYVMFHYMLHMQIELLAGAGHPQQSPIRCRSGCLKDQKKAPFEP